MRVRLGLHINGHGNEDMVRRYVDAVRPPFMKFLGDAADPGQMDYCRARGSKVIYRVVLGPEGISKDGINHIVGRAAETAGHWDYLEFANEEEQGRDDAGEWDRLCRLMQMAMDACEERGWRACILNTSVGQPELRVTGKPRWERPESVAMLQQAAAGGHIVGAHEYYRPRPWEGVEGPPGTSSKTAWTMPGKARGWWMLRVARSIAEWRALGIPLPGIVITESGRDDISGTPGFGKGWRDDPVTPDGDYADFMAGYCRHLSAWPEVLGAVDFGFSTSQPEKWGSFDLATNDARQFDRMIEVMRPAEVPTPPPPPVTPPTPPPTPPEDTVSNQLATHLATALGPRFSDVRVAMPRHDTERFGPLALANLKGIAVHHSAAPRDQTPAVIAAYHVSHNGWAGIGYHLVIRRGMVYYVGDITTARAHVAGRNHELVGICVTGDYTQEGVHTEDAAALRDLVAALDGWLGRQLAVDGHGAWALAGHGTACPGALQQVAKAVRAAPTPTPVPNPTPTIQWAKVVYFLEEAIRAAEREGLGLEAGYLKSTALAEAIKRRDGKA